MSGFSWLSWSVIAVACILTAVFSVRNWQGKTLASNRPNLNPFGSESEFRRRVAGVVTVAPFLFSSATIAGLAHHEGFFGHATAVHDLWKIVFWLSSAVMVVSLAVEFFVMATGRPTFLIPPRQRVR